MNQEEIERLQAQNRQLKQLLVDADEVARHRGDEFGLSDSLDNDGDSYPSAALVEELRKAKAEGFRPQLTLTEAQRQSGDQSSPWYDPHFENAFSAGDKVTSGG